MTKTTATTPPHPSTPIQTSDHEQKAVRGRPTLYDESYCEDLIDIMSNGDHVCHFCKKHRIHKDTFYEWVKQHPVFSDAYKIAKEFAEVWWTDNAKNGMNEKHYNAAIFMMVMRNKFRWSNFRETYKSQKIKGFDGNLKQKIEVINKQLESGEMAADVHATIMSSIANEATIDQKLELEAKVDALMKKAGIES